MADNPFSRQAPNNQLSKLYAVESLKGLKYLDYELISDTLRKDAKDKYNDEVNENNNNANSAADEENKALDQELVDAKIDCTDRMLDRIMVDHGKEQKRAEEETGEQILDMKILQKFNDYWGQLEQDVDDNTEKYQTDMKALNRELKRVQIYCEEQLRKEELTSERQSTMLISDFTSLRKHKLRDLDLQPDKSLQLDEYEGELIVACTHLEDHLMELEMHLQDALIKSTQDMQDKTKVLQSEMYNKTVEFFKQVQEFAANFSTDLKDSALQEQIQFEANLEEFIVQMNQNEDDSELTAQLNLLGEKEPLVNVLDQLREFFEAQITKNEKEIQKRTKDDIEDNMKRINDN